MGRWRLLSKTGNTTQQAPAWQNDSELGRVCSCATAGAPRRRSSPGELAPPYGALA
jgi:hypothetical protein